MARLTEIDRYITDELETGKFGDSSLNGIQVEGAGEVRMICGATDAGLSVIEEAGRRGAQMLLVHHGLFWGGAMPITGSHRKAVKTMLEGGLTLYASHLPLDAHSKYGNNYGVARLLGLSELAPCCEAGGQLIGAKGFNSVELPLEEYVARLSKEPGKGEILQLAFGPKVPQKVCVVTGAGADQLYRYREDDFDTLVTGEPRQFAYHFAKENGLNVIFGGHYRTETLGVRLLGEELARRFDVKFEFIDEPTGI